MAKAGDQPIEKQPVGKHIGVRALVVFGVGRVEPVVEDLGAVVEGLGQAEVHQLQGAVLQHYVLGFEVVVAQAERVQRFEGLGELDRDEQPG